MATVTLGRPTRGSEVLVTRVVVPFNTSTQPGPGSGSGVRPGPRTRPLPLGLPEGTPGEGTTREEM